MWKCRFTPTTRVQPDHVGALPPVCGVGQRQRGFGDGCGACLTGDPTMVFHSIAYDPLTASVLSLAEIRQMVNECWPRTRITCLPFGIFVALARSTLRRSAIHGGAPSRNCACRFEMRGRRVDQSAVLQCSRLHRCCVLGAEVCYEAWHRRSVVGSRHGRIRRGRPLGGVSGSIPARRWSRWSPMRQPRNPHPTATPSPTPTITPAPTPSGSCAPPPGAASLMCRATTRPLQ